MKHRHLGTSVSAAVFLSSLAGTVQAQNSAGRALVLNEQAQSLLKQADYEHACPMFKQSYELDADEGTLLNLAECYEKQGKVASAWSSFRAALKIAERDGQSERVEFAKQHLAVLEPQLSQITIEVPDRTAEPGLTVTLDGVPIPTVAEVAAPRLIDNDVKKVAVEDEASPTNPRTVGYVIGGAGLVALGVGSYFGLRAMSKWHDRNENCAAGCTNIAKNAGDDAQSAALIADVGFGVGLIAIGIGGYLLLSAPSSSEVSAARVSTEQQARLWQVTPMLGPEGGGLVLRGNY